MAMSYFLTEWWLHSGSFCNITELYIFLCALSGAYVTLQNKKVLKLQQSGMTISVTELIWLPWEFLTLSKNVTNLRLVPASSVSRVYLRAFQVSGQAPGWASFCNFPPWGSERNSTTFLRYMFVANDRNQRELA